MRHRAALLPLACALAASAACSAGGSPAPSVPSAGSTGGRSTIGVCHPGDPLAGVYHPQRLEVQRDCTTVTGTVDCVRSEPDGDVHIRLQVDTGFSSLLTPGNDAEHCPGAPGPHLVVEIIPQQCGGVPQRDAEDNCADNGGFTSPRAPAPGQHVSVTGPLVVDTSPGHGQSGSGWAEIHPAESVGGATAWLAPPGGLLSLARGTPGAAVDVTRIDLSGAD